MITGTIRKDGFSGFGASNKYATFPSLSFAWVASEENFIKNMGDWLNIFKIKNFLRCKREPGNRTLFKLLKDVHFFIYFWFINMLLVFIQVQWGITIWDGNLPNSLNFGIDYGVLNQRISGSIDVYTAETSNVLVQRTLPTTTGYQSVWTNIGGISNKGIELALTTLNIESPLRWETRFSFSLNRDKITKLYGGPEDKDIGNSWFIGKPISAIYEYTRTGGVWTEQELYSGQIPVTGFYPGQLRLADLNGDGQVRAE